ncbi:MAG: hypothetical protein IJM45_10415 [Clostridia bacterium]|nr:hypothetical protein [Clostridia bacterium]
MKKAFVKHRYSVGVFAFLLLHSFLVSGGAKPWSNDFVTYSFHAVDFSMGFCTRILPGAVYKLLVGKWSMEAVNAFDSVFMILLFAVLSVFCEKLILGVGKKDRLAFLLVVLLFLTGPCTFPMYIIELGMIDVWWVFFTAAAVVLLSCRRLFPLVVPIGALCVTIHFSAMYTFVPLIVLLILYKCASEQNKKTKAALFSVAVLTAAAACATAVYFLVNEKNNLVYTREEFDAVLASRGVTFFDYYDYAFYGFISDAQPRLVEAMSSSEPVSFIQRVMQQISINASTLEFATKLYVLVLMIPAVVLLFGFVFTAVKGRSGKAEKAVLLSAPALFVVSLGFGWLFSTDVIRFLGHSFLGLFTFVMFVIYIDNKDRNAENGPSENKDPASYFTDVFRRIDPKITFIYFAMYVLTVWEPYRT